MNKWQRTLHGTLMVSAALNVVQDFMVVQPALAQQAVTVVNTPAVSGTVSVGNVPTVAGTVSVGNANANGQATMTNSSPVALASNQAVGDPCTFQAKTQLPISSALGSSQLVAGVSGKKIYVCGGVVIAGAAINLSFIEGTGSSCATATADLGSTGSAGGMPIVANGGFVPGGGIGTGFQTQNSSATLCMLQSGTALIAGGFTYVQQ